MTQHQNAPGSAQESAWDYPRPPSIEASSRHIQVVFNGITIAETERALRVLETSHPPVFYIPPHDVRLEYLHRTERTSWCEWKGQAGYYTVTVDARKARNAAWSYPEPAPGYRAIRDHVAFYPSRMDACLVDGERARPQPGGFYGGWITSDILGPFKGGPGTVGW
jgi:uncharacterized protein (DUF427 family)